MQVRAKPKDYSKSRLAAYLKNKETQMLNDDELIMDMFQVLASGTYGLVTHVGHYPLFTAQEASNVSLRLMLRW